MSELQNASRARPAATGSTWPDDRLEIEHYCRQARIMRAQAVADAVRALRAGIGKIASRLGVAAAMGRTSRA